MFLQPFCFWPVVKKTILSPQNGSNSDLSSTLKSGKKIGHFTQTNLVADLPGQAAQTDPMLLNAWGLTWAPSGIAWIGSEVGHVSNVYDREGHTVLGPVTIPSQTATTGGHPSGVTFNSSTGFPLATGWPCTFYFRRNRWSNISMEWRTGNTCCTNRYYSPFCVYWPYDSS